MLEKHWEMLRWLNNFILENKEVWDELDIAKKMEKGEIEKEQRWKNLSEQEKSKEIKDDLSREKKQKMAKIKRASWREWREPADQTLSPTKETKIKRDQCEGLQHTKPAKRQKEGMKMKITPKPCRGPSENNTHLGGPNPGPNLDLDCGPVNWDICEQKSAFKTKLSEIKQTKLSDIKEESTWWNKKSGKEVGGRKGAGGGGSGEVSRSGSHAPTSPRAPQNEKRLEKLAGERGGDPSPHVTLVLSPGCQEQNTLISKFKNQKKNIKTLQKEPMATKKLKN